MNGFKTTEATATVIDGRRCAVATTTCLICNQSKQHVVYVDGRGAVSVAHLRELADAAHEFMRTHKPRCSTGAPQPAEEKTREAPPSLADLIKSKEDK